MRPAFFLTGVVIIALARLAVAGPEPSVLEVQKAALQYHHLNPAEVRRWKRDARAAPWLPRLQFGYDRNVDSKTVISIDESASVSSKGVVIGPKLSKTDSNAADQDSFDIRAVWSLDELVFNRNQISLNEELRDQMREVQRVTRDVNRAYFDRREVIRRLRLVPGEGKDSGLRIETERLTAELDAMTGGWFSQALQGES